MLNKEEYFEFLDDLRESGTTNMFGAVSYLIYEFDNIDKKTGGEILTEWMRTFGERHPEE